MLELCEITTYRICKEIAAILCGEVNRIVGD